VDTQQDGAVEIDAIDEVTYWSIVWGQFKKNKIAYGGFWSTIGLVALAIYAPLLVLERPFYISYTNAEGAAVTEYPWFWSLFDRLLFENGVDIFFNILMVVSPLALLTGFVIARMAKGNPVKIRSRLWRRYVGSWVAILVITTVVVSLNPWSHPFMDYRDIYAQGVAQTELSKVTGIKADKIPSAIFPPVAQSFRNAELSEVLVDAGGDHLLGTDNRGRDVFARMIYGTRIALTIGVVAVSIYLFIGVILGALAGFFAGKVDMAVLRLIEIMRCFPTLLLIMTLVAFVDDPTIWHVMLIIGIVRWTGPARLVRGEFLKLRGEDFVAAAVASGVPQWRVIFRHVLPNALSPVLVNATFGVAVCILIEATLSFLGLGDASAPSWGETLNIGRQNSELIMILAPGIAIFITVSLLNLVGEGLRDALDPKLRR
jgi:peptide/nickel transport system permease protein